MSWLSWCRRLQQTLQLTSSGMSLCRFPIMSMAGKACWMVNTCDATIPWALALQSATSPCKIECKVTHHKDSASEKSIDRTKALPILLQTFPNEPSGTLGDPSGTLRGPSGTLRGPSGTLGEGFMAAQRLAEFICRTQMIIFPRCLGLSQPTLSDQARLLTSLRP